MVDRPIPKTVLVGAGVVGCAILRAHLDARVPVCLADRDREALQQAVRLHTDGGEWSTSEVQLPGSSLPAIAVTCEGSEDPSAPAVDAAILAGRNDLPPWTVIESISERVDLKRSFYAEAEQWFGPTALLCSNTSTLRISDIAAEMEHPERFCGMHFFMPVYNRPAVEIARGDKTSDATIARCEAHVRRIGKQPLVVRDGPGFIVNRLLSPYLNEALLMLCRGVSAECIEIAALRYGMPMSPLELIDWIGTRTMFDAGRAFWQAFPSRISPAAILAALVKNKRFGRAEGAGVYDYVDGERSPTIAPAVMEFSERYRRDEIDLTEDDVMRLLAIPMWIEAAIARRDAVVASTDELDLAMRGGLGFDPERSWLAFFDQLGSASILAAVDSWSHLTPAVGIPDQLRELLQASTPSQALTRFASAQAAPKRL